MTTLYLVRHGRAAAGWNVDPDPPLDDLGRQQALDVAAKLSSKGPLSVYSSPLLRCQQTAFPLATAWGTQATIEPGVSEIPSPEGYSLENRAEWLREAMAGTWTQVAEKSGDLYAQYRQRVVDTVASMREDAVIFSHYIAINVIIGEALNDDRVVVANLSNCSVTTVDVSSDGTMSLTEIGGEGESVIL